MNKIINLLLAISIAHISISQSIFESDLSSWSGGVPTDWMGASTNISSNDVHELTASVAYGTSYASLINTTTSHKRFSTQPITVHPDSTYLIEMWVSGYTGELRTGYYDVNNSTYGSYNSYVDLSIVSGSTTTRTLVSQTVTINSNCSNAEFILSIKNTDSIGSASPWFVGILVDSVAINLITPNNQSVSIYDIQYTTSVPANSPYMGQNVNTGGIVTYIRADGTYYLKSGTGDWSGIYVYDSTSNIAVGDSITLTCLVEEFYGLTELKNVSNLSVVSSGNPFNSNIVTSAEASSENYEGCLITVNNATCTNNNAGFGEWIIDDGSGACNVDDFFFSYTPTLNNIYNVTGFLDFSFSNFKILPRDIDDIDEITTVNENNKNDIIIYPNPAKDLLNIELQIDATIKITDLSGKTCYNKNFAKGNHIIDLQNFSNGNYIINIGEHVKKLLIQ